MNRGIGDRSEAFVVSYRALELFLYVIVVIMEFKVYSVDVNQW